MKRYKIHDKIILAKDDSEFIKKWRCTFFPTMKGKDAQEFMKIYSQFLNSVLGAGVGVSCKSPSRFVWGLYHLGILGD